MGKLIELNAENKHRRLLRLNPELLKSRRKLEEDVRAEMALSGYPDTRVACPVISIKRDVDDFKIYDDQVVDEGWEARAIKKHHLRAVACDESSTAKHGAVGVAFLADLTPVGCKWENCAESCHCQKMDGDCRKRINLILPVIKAAMKQDPMGVLRVLYSLGGRDTIEFWKKSFFDKG